MEEDRMTEKQAYQESIAMWAWMVANPGKGKGDYFKETGDVRARDYKNKCPLCKWYKDGHGSCAACCLDDCGLGSLFDKWVENRYPASVGKAILDRIVKAAREKGYLLSRFEDGHTYRHYGPVLKGWKEYRKLGDLFGCCELNHKDNMTPAFDGKPHKFTQEIDSSLARNGGVFDNTRGGTWTWDGWAVFFEEVKMNDDENSILSRLDKIENRIERLEGKTTKKTSKRVEFDEEKNFVMVGPTRKPYLLAETTVGGWGWMLFDDCRTGLAVANSGVEAVKFAYDNEWSVYAFNDCIPAIEFFLEKRREYEKKRLSGDADRPDAGSSPAAPDAENL